MFPTASLLPTFQNNLTRELPTIQKLLDTPLLSTPHVADDFIMTRIKFKYCFKDKRFIEI